MEAASHRRSTGRFQDVIDSAMRPAMGGEGGGRRGGKREGEGGGEEGERGGREGRGGGGGGRREGRGGRRGRGGGRGGEKGGEGGGGGVEETKGRGGGEQRGGGGLVGTPTECGAKLTARAVVTARRQGMPRASCTPRRAPGDPDEGHAEAAHLRRRARRRCPAELHAHPASEDGRSDAAVAREEDHVVAPSVQLVAGVEPSTPHVRRGKVIHRGIRCEDRAAADRADPQEDVGVLAQRRARVVVAEPAQLGEHRPPERHVRADAVVDVDGPVGERGEPVGQRAVGQQPTDRLLVALLARHAVACATRDGHHRRILERGHQRVLPAGPEHHIVVEEAHDLTADMPQCLVARARHPSREVRGVHVHDRPADLVRDVAPVGRRGVDDHDLGVLAEPLGEGTQAAPEELGPLVRDDAHAQLRCVAHGLPFLRRYRVILSTAAGAPRRLSILIGCAATLSALSKSVPWQRRPGIPPVPATAPRPLLSKRFDTRVASAAETSPNRRRGLHCGGTATVARRRAVQRLHYPGPPPPSAADRPCPPSPVGVTLRSPAPSKSYCSRAAGTYKKFVEVYEVTSQCEP